MQSMQCNRRPVGDEVQIGAGLLKKLLALRCLDWFLSKAQRRSQTFNLSASIWVREQRPFMQDFWEQQT